MRELYPCPACRRHVAPEAACPFCGAAQPPRAARAMPRGRRSRAAVFATLAACGHAQHAPQTDQATATSEPKVTDETIAPPKGLALDPGTGGITGTVRDTTDHPVNGVTVTLTSGSGKSYSAQSDAAGRFSFASVAPGIYAVSYYYQDLTFRHEGVTVTADKVVLERLSSWSLPPPAEQVPVAKPYGAPPARRRVV